MKKNKLVRPILKWVGGKRQLLEEIEKRLPKRISYYVEPFVGGGAVVMKNFGNLGAKNISYNLDIKSNARGYEQLATMGLKSAKRLA